MLKIRENKGITLVALIVTIIILLILAGVAIGQITGNGLFIKAQLAAKETKYANAVEKVVLAVNASYDTTGKINDNLLKENVNKIDGLDKKVETVAFDLKIVVDGFEFTISEYGKIIGEKIEVATLPENSKDINAGIEVKLPSDWGTKNVSYIKTSDGTEVTTLETVATVYAVSVGSGDTVPVPKGFYYVGGNLNNGVIISDNELDKYDGKIDKTTYEYTTSLKGNQFVWIPCSTSEYKKSDSWNSTTQTNTSLGNAWWDTKTAGAELTQIQQYGGFYVGRYEAGLASSIEEFTTNQKNDGSNQVYNKNGVPQSKAGVIPWMFIDWDHSKANAQSMYSENQYVNSDLITGTQWDVMLKKMVGKTIGETTGENKITLIEADFTNSEKWGNYANNAIEYSGRLAIADYGTTNSKAWTLKPFGTTITGTTSSYSSKNGDLLTTGASKTTQVYHIYDVAGNIWEWTEETSFYGGNTNTQYCMCRGGGFIGTSSIDTACYRWSDTVSCIALDIGFRVVLYIK